MRTLNLLIAALSIVVLVYVHSTSATPKQEQPAKKHVKVRTEVKVYFYHDPGEYIDISPVTRSVSATAPARAAVQALLNGPTSRELKNGFDSLVDASHFRIGSLTIKDGTARINLVSRRSWLGWGGDLAPIRFKKAVELTLQQFPTVQKVIVSLNGDPRFAEEN